MTEAAPHPLVRSFVFLRRGVGLLGMGLPFVLIVGNLLIGGGLLYSVSGYYHSDLRDIYVGGMCAVGVFLLFYRGYERTDRIASIIAGIAAIGAALFPLTPPGPVADNQQIVGVLHVVFAAGLFLTFAYFCLFEFRKTGQLEPTARKLKRNQVFLVCGVIIVLCMVLAVVSVLTPALNEARPILWLEAIATVAFGVAWLTKGEMILGDLGPARQ